MQRLQPLRPSRKAFPAKEALFPSYDRTHFIGGLCVPIGCPLEDGRQMASVCQDVGVSEFPVQTTAAYLAPRVVPWWRAPRPEPQLLNEPGAKHVASMALLHSKPCSNCAASRAEETHYLLPPPLAVTHKVYKARHNLTWAAARPGGKHGPVRTSTLTCHHCAA